MIKENLNNEKCHGFSLKVETGSILKGKTKLLFIAALGEHFKVKAKRFKKYLDVITTGHI